MHHHCTSQVFHYGTSDADACIIVASDGVWEFMPSEDAIALCFEHRAAGAQVRVGGWLWEEGWSG